MSLRVAKIFPPRDSDIHKKFLEHLPILECLGNALNRHATKSVTAESAQRASVLSGASNDREEPSAPGSGWSHLFHPETARRYPGKTYDVES